jgi:hypothetical protein
MKNPDKESLGEQLLATEKAIDAGLRNEFDTDSCDGLANCLVSLMDLIADEDEALPIGIEDDTTLAAKALIMIDVAYCCWRNDTAQVTLPDDVLLNHIARMKLNPKHCKTVLDYTRMFLNKYDRLLSVESATLHVR